MSHRVGLILKCPKCGHVAPLDDCDCCGADFGNVFCPACQTEFSTTAKNEAEPTLFEGKK